MSSGSAIATTKEEIALDKRVWQYALPLIPLGLIDWTNGIADRYVIGGLLTVADAGVYAAAYGLASRPFSILGQSIELAIRPVYQAAVSAAQREKADRLIWLWFASVTAAGVLGVALITHWRADLAHLLLGASFQRGAELMPWIASGYALLAMAQVFQRICFAHGDSRSVLWIQTSAAIVGLIATILGSRGWGLLGAAVAVPICFAVQLVTSVLCARSSRHRAKRLFAQEIPI
jgi:O-antigen/teichoic acid export membrane protein